MRINEIVVKTILCSPLPIAPKYRETKIAISKLQIAEANFIEKVLKILINTIFVYLFCYTHLKMNYQYYHNQTLMRILLIVICQNPDDVQSSHS